MVLLLLFPTSITKHKPYMLTSDYLVERLSLTVTNSTITTLEAPHHAYGQSQQILDLKFNFTLLFSFPLPKQSFFFIIINRILN